MAFDCSAGFALECWTLFNRSPVLSWGPRRMDMSTLTLLFHGTACFSNVWSATTETILPKSLAVAPCQHVDRFCLVLLWNFSSGPQAMLVYRRNFLWKISCGKQFRLKQRSLGCIASNVGVSTGRILDVGLLKAHFAFWGFVLALMLLS